MPFPIIDSHQHVWDPARAEYSWLGPQHAPIDGAMTFDELQPELEAAGVAFTVQVQSADNSADTELMRESAAAHPEVAGIVGWVPLDRPDEAAATLAGWRGDSVMVGVRNLIHDRADADWLLRPEVDEGLGLLEEAGLPFDVVAVLPRHLELVPIIAERHPRLRMVIDHLSKPPIGLDSWEPWSTLIAEAAAVPTVYGKVSGLYSATADPGSWTTDSVRPALERALEVFGADRLMYGGDWPISVLAGGYTRVWQGLAPLFAELSDADREQLLGRTAATFYALDPARLGLAGPAAN
ncbi:amidohydrolase family protein [Herbiconiux sp. CPCC 205716]|uniref:Amidohydrolase family protein n=1 Tax=Herbiconiux gentiana TaxID=2970912 RepID=A0ABT2GEY8_9MICO|nr:amidohydrolase family protein [Herbiconiux gentiana]MCS5714768.1 amidohydrolase family protein [Herbiconiux gentiana]